VACDNNQCQTEEIKPRINKVDPSDTYWVEGGMGKHVMFTAIIPQLAKKSPSGKINMISAFYDVFFNNPYVANSWSIDEFNKFKHEFQPYITKIENYEPYKGTFALYYNKHLVKDWADHYGVEFDIQKDRPQIFLDEKLAKKMRNTLKKKVGENYIVVQFTGGQPAIAYQDGTPYQINDLIMRRNYPFPMAKHFILKLRQKLPDLKIIDFSLPNEHPGLPGVIRIPAPYIAFYEVAKHAKTFVGIDSSFAHIAAAAGKPGIVLWGGTRMEQYGWPLHTNLTNYDGKSKFDENDPFYVAIDYDRLVEKVVKRVKETKS